MERYCKDFHCQVCDRDFPVVRLAGNHKAKKRVCESCRTWHKWCPCCESPRLRSEFSICAKSWDGLQGYCDRCLVRQRGHIRIRTCFNCTGEYMITNSTKYNGRTEWMCADCTATVKYCKRCSTIKPRSEFNTARGKAHGLHAHCRPCQKETWRAQPRQAKRRAKLKAFGLTHDEYNLMRIAQNDLCAICKNPETDLHSAEGKIVRELAIDHDHRTGAVRALLCGRCNRAIGLMLDDPERMVAAAEYLRSYQEVSDLIDLV